MTGTELWGPFILPTCNEKRGKKIMYSVGLKITQLHKMLYTKNDQSIGIGQSVNYTISQDPIVKSRSICWHSSAFSTTTTATAANFVELWWRRWILAKNNIGTTLPSELFPVPSWIHHILCKVHPLLLLLFAPVFISHQKIKYINKTETKFQEQLCMYM